MKSPYTFNKNTEGNVEVFQDGQRISTGTAGAASRYGYTEPATTPTQSPTTLSSTNITESVIPDLKKRIEDLSKTGKYTDASGTPRYADETPIPDTPQRTTLHNPVTGETQEFDNTNDKTTIKSLQDQGWEAGPEDVYTKSTRELLNSMKESLDASTKRTIDNIEQQFAQRKTQLTEINRRQEEGTKQSLLMGGSSRYAQVSSGGIVNAQETSGLLALAELDAQEKTLINSALAAKESGDFQLLEKELTLAETKRKEKQTAATELSKSIAEQNKKIKESMIQASRDGAISDLISQGLTDPSEILNVLNYDDKGKLIGDFTAKEVGDAVKNLAPNKTVSDLGIDGNMMKLAKEQGWLPKDATIFDYWKKEAESKKSPAAEKVGMGVGGMSDFQAFSKESIAMSALPPTLRNSDAEKAYYLGGIRAGLKEGKTPYEIADTLMGYNITDKSSFSEGLRKYISIAGGADKNVAPELARLINGGEYEKAISIVENEVYTKIQKQNPDSFVSESDATYVASKVNEIKTLLGEDWTDSIGPFEGTFNAALMRFRTRDYQKIKTKINTITSELVNKRAGSNISESEWKRMVVDAIPQMNDKAGIFNDKLNELKGAPLTRLNSERSSFELPTISEKELFDRKLRIPAYSSHVALDIAGDPLGVTTTNDPMGLGI